MGSESHAKGELALDGDSLEELEETISRPRKEPYRLKGSWDVRR
jgi:hypothetical protein